MFVRVYVWNINNGNIDNDLDNLIFDNVSPAVVYCNIQY